MSDALSYCRFRLSVSSAQTSLPLPAAESSCSQVTTLKGSQKLNASLLLARLLITRAPTWGRWGKVRLVYWCFFRCQSFGTLQSAAVRMCSVLQHLGTWEPDAFCQRKKSYSVNWRAIFFYSLPCFMTSFEKQGMNDQVLSTKVNENEFYICLKHVFWKKKPV